MFKWFWKFLRETLGLNEACRFSEGCSLYQEDHPVCNERSERFIGSGKSLCGRYRNLASS